MNYTEIKKGIFIERPNRFVARVLMDGHEEIVHVKNTGRCREILVQGTEVVLERGHGLERKTKYSLVAAYKGDMLINIDSQIPNAVVYEALLNEDRAFIKGIKNLRREVTFRTSRFDLFFETSNGRGFIEVKGVTLENNGVAMFPDAPTIRGKKHVLEMIEAVKESYFGYIVFLIEFKGAKVFTPNYKTDPDFSKALKLALKNGVSILAFDSFVNEDCIAIGDRVPVEL